jgi:hypothetical protein
VCTSILGCLVRRPSRSPVFGDHSRLLEYAVYEP